MSYKLFRIYLAVKEPLPEALKKNPTPAELAALSKMNWLDIFMTATQKMKSYSENITPTIGKEQEDTTIAKTHTHRHDEGLSCGDEEDI